MTPAEFKAAFPEFSSETDNRIQTFIDNADPFFDAERWGNLYFAGVSNYVAHKITVTNARIASNATAKLADTATSKKVGDVQVNKSEAALLAKMKDPYQATEYGQEYRRLVRLVGVGGLAV